MSTLPGQTPGRNDPCHCGSGKKYKSCCLGKDEAAAREARAKAEAEAPVPPPDPVKSVPATPVRPPTRQPWKRGLQNTRGFQKITSPRKVGGG